MSAVYTEYYVQLKDSRTRRPIDDDSGLYTVMTATTPAAATCYSDANGTALTLPATMTDGVIRFFTAISVTTVDVTILTAAGQAYFIEGLTPSQHYVDVDPDRTAQNLFIVPYNLNSGCDALMDTGFDLLAGMRIKDVLLQSTTGSTANGVYIGVSGTTNGFLSIATTTSTGWKVYGSPIVTSATGSAYYVSATQIRGSLLSEWNAGLITASAGGAKGYWSRKSYIPTAATSLIVMVAATNSGGSGAGYIYLEYDLLPTMGN